MNALTHEQMNVLRDTLTQRRRQLHHRLSSIRDDLRQGDGPLDANGSEQAQELENDEVLAHLEDVSMEHLAQIDEALHRMDEGSYGQCAMCDEPIAVRRLEALPFVISCIACATEQERLKT